MTKEELGIQLKTHLGACFPKFRPDSWTALRDAYYEHLSAFPLYALKSACQNVIQNEGRLEYHAGEFPSAGELFGLCRGWMQRKNYPADDFRSKFHPQAHDCHPQVKAMADRHASQKAKHEGFSRLTEARSVLALASWYEAVHVLCPTVGPVCPKCGVIQEPYVNPLIESLIVSHPQETAGWNSHHKGFLVCRNCLV